MKRTAEDLVIVYLQGKVTSCTGGAGAPTAIRKGAHRTIGGLEKGGQLPDFPEGNTGQSGYKRSKERGLSHLG